MTMLVQIAYIILVAIAPIHGLGRTILEGDVYIEFIGAIYSEPGMHQNLSCSNIESETVQNVQAIKWTLSQLNDVNFIPDLKIGLRVSETCKEDGKAEQLAHQLASELYFAKEVDVIGVIGSEYSSETEAISRLLSSLPEEYRLLQLGFSSTSASLRNRDMFKNFYRTIPPDDIQVEVMIKYIKILKWTYMAIIYDDDTYGRGGKDELLKRSKGIDVCFSTTIPVDNLNYDQSKLETEINDKILNAEVPISGILVFGTSGLAELVFVATENILEHRPNISRPVFLFSEAGSYIRGQHTNISKGAFVLSPPRRVIGDFQTEWTSIFTDISRLYQEVESNQWIRDVFNSNSNCSLATSIDKNTCEPMSASEVENVFPDSVYNQYAIQAAMIISKVVEKIYGSKCSNRTSACSVPRYDFVKELAAIPEINFDDFGSFRFEEFQNPDLIVSFDDSCEITLPDLYPVYEVFNYQLCENGRFCLINVAEYKKSQDLEVKHSNIKDYDENGRESSWPNIRKAQCPDGSVCLNCFVERDSILYIPGDMYIVGIVPVHNTGQTPLRCGDIKNGGLDIVETIRFAISDAKTKPDANIGVIIIDSCNDPQIIQEKILTLHRLGVYIEDQYQYVGDKILGYIGGWSSDVSKAVVHITSRLQYPQIAYGSTAPILSERSLYPYFLRVPSPDDTQAETILKLVKELEGNFIQILYSQSEYGAGGRDLILDYIKTSSEYDICVTQEIAISRSSNKPAVLANLRKFPEAKIVVLFLGSFEIEHMIDTFNTIEKNEFLFISSEGWGTRVNISEYTKLVGSLTITLELPINEKLKDHMKQLKPDGFNADTWIRPYMENQFDCYFQWSYNKTSNKRCAGSELLDVYNTDFRLDTWVPFAEIGVTALLEGVAKALNAKCNGNTRTLCDAYRNSSHAVYEQIKNYQRLGNSGFRTRVFNDNGDGTAGYQIYIIDLDTTGKAKYRKIGDSSLSVGTEPGILTFQTTLFKSIRGEVVESKCSSDIQICNQCFSLKEPEECSMLPTVMIIMIVILGLVCVGLVGLLLFICNRHGCCIRIENGRPKITNTYLTPIYSRQRKANGGEGSFHHEENYDNIPIPREVLVNRSASYLSRSQTLDCSSSSAGNTESAGSSASGRPTNEAGGRSPTVMIGRDNVAFGNEKGESANQGSSQHMFSSYRLEQNEYVLGNKSPTNPSAPTPSNGAFTTVPPARVPEYVNNADDGYITAVSRSDSDDPVETEGTQEDIIAKERNQSISQTCDDNRL